MRGLKSEYSIEFWKMSKTCMQDFVVLMTSTIIWLHWDYNSVMARYPVHLTSSSFRFLQNFSNPPFPEHSLRMTVLFVLITFEWYLNTILIGLKEKTPQFLLFHTLLPSKRRTSFVIRNLNIGTGLCQTILAIQEIIPPPHPMLSNCQIA